MAGSKSYRPLAAVFFASGIWDLFAAFVYAFLIGTVYTEPPVDRFYALFIATFLFSFAYLQIVSSCNIRRYLPVVGGVAIGRALYVILLFGSLLLIPGFPATFWWTGVVDLAWTVLYLLLALNLGIRIRDLFLPEREGS